MTYGDDWGVAGIERLQDSGADFIGIPCNSAHKHFAAKNCEFIFDPIWQESINEIILRIKGNEDLEKMQQQSADQQPIAYIDSSEALAKALIRMYLSVIAERD
jgi:hypothetical protein